MIRYLTAGESHGPGLACILEGMPANLKIDLDKINHELYRRQQGHGRGGRMQIEKDRIEILSGIRFGKTLGSPISFILRNKDWENRRDEMALDKGKPVNKITRPRPGHADLSGALKYDFDDIRNVLERSSARETAMRVAAGAFVKQLLEEFNILIFSHVLQIGPVKAHQQAISEILKKDEINKLANRSMVRCLDKDAEGKMIEYMMCGTPILCSNFAHWKPYVEDEKTGMTIEPDNMEQIVDTCERMLNNPRQLGEMSKRGMEVVRTKYNWDTEFRVLCQCYEDLLKKKR